MKRAWFILAVLALITCLTGISELFRGIAQRGADGVNWGRIIFPLLLTVLFFALYRKEQSRGCARGEKREAFCCSLCHGGIVGGGLYLDQQAVTYICHKVTVEQKYRKLVLPLGEIEKVTWKGAIFPIAEFRMQSGEEYKMLIFNRRRFEKCFKMRYQKKG